MSHFKLPQLRQRHQGLIVNILHSTTLRTTSTHATASPTTAQNWIPHQPRPNKGSIISHLVIISPTFITLFRIILSSTLCHRGGITGGGGEGLEERGKEVRTCTELYMTSAHCTLNVHIIALHTISLHLLGIQPRGGDGGGRGSKRREHTRLQLKILVIHWNSIPVPLT